MFVAAAPRTRQTPLEAALGLRRITPEATAGPGPVKTHTRSGAFVLRRCLVWGVHTDDNWGVSERL
jgi:hypothetical protein